MAAQQIQLRFQFTSDPQEMFYILHNPKALANWMADEVRYQASTKTYIFTWSGFSEEARIVEKDEDDLKLKWEWIERDKEAGDFLAFQIIYNEYDNCFELIVDDFCEEGGEESLRKDWDEIFKKMMRVTA